MVFSQSVVHDMKSIDFTERAKPWLNAFTFDLAQTPEKVIDRIKDFPGNQEMVSVALKQGLEVIDPKDPAVAKELFNFIEWYSTGKISKIEVTYNEN